VVNASNLVKNEPHLLRSVLNDRLVDLSSSIDQGLVEIAEFFRNCVPEHSNSPHPEIRFELSLTNYPYFVPSSPVYHEKKEYAGSSHGRSYLETKPTEDPCPSGPEAECMLCDPLH